MPHMCMECKNIIESPELDLNKGCPVCGCKKFQYVRPKNKDLTVAEYVAKVAGENKVKEVPLPQIRLAKPVKDADPVTPAPDKAIKTRPAAARTHVAVKPAPADGEKKAEKIVRAPSLKKDREKDKDGRVESILIVEKGSYDINLPMLLNRKGLVMSKGDGVYMIDLPSAMDPKKKRSRK
jgi:uncharacterized protein